MPETVVHFQVRMSPGLHEHLARRAKEQRVSLNALVVGLLTQAVADHPAESVVAVAPVKVQSA